MSLMVDASFCVLCTKQFNSKRNFVRHHNAIHLKLKLYKCKICDKSYTDSTPLRYHMEIHKLNFEPNKRHFKCSECDKSFMLQRYLDHHKINAHTDKRKISCELCFKKFSSASKLQKHRSIHHDREKKIECPELNCGSTFLHFKITSENI